jgi:uncharacterized integral membrane protein (TIGR00697 family)
MSICDTLAFKAVDIYGYSFASSGIVYSFNFFIASVMTEVYGYKLAGRVVWIQLLCHFIFVLTVNLVVFIPSPANSTTFQSYYDLYHNLWRVFLASCFAIPAAYFVNDLIISKMKIYLYGKAYMFRFVISNVIGSGVLVAISYPANFYDQFPLSQIAVISFHTWIYKVVISVLLIPVSIWLSRTLKRLEGLDYYDYGISYNPLSIFSSRDEGENAYAAK